MEAVPEAGTATPDEPEELFGEELPLVVQGPVETAEEALNYHGSLGSAVGAGITTSCPTRTVSSGGRRRAC